jgi:uncharacterized protein (DUF1778 family)
MPTITIRLSADEKADLEAHARGAGQSLSDYVRETLALRTDKRLVAVLESVGEVAEDHDRRLARLERLANLD